MMILVIVIMVIHINASMGNKYWGNNMSTITPHFCVGSLLQNGDHGSIIIKSERNELRFIANS